MKQVLSFDQTKHLQELGLYHIYTLPDIPDKLPCFIGNQVLTMQKLADSYTCLYIEPYTRSMINITESKEPIPEFACFLCQELLDECSPLDIRIYNVIEQIFVYCRFNCIDIEWFIEQKMRYNELRPELNGKRY